MTTPNRPEWRALIDVIDEWVSMGQDLGCSNPKLEGKVRATVALLAAASVERTTTHPALRDLPVYQVRFNGGSPKLFPVGTLGEERLEDLHAKVFVRADELMAALAASVEEPQEAALDRRRVTEQELQDIIKECGHRGESVNLARTLGDGEDNEPIEIEPIPAAEPPTQERT